ncbi:MAG TPA: hypothetical protein VI248_02015 [Kineosporiaceae bacterium]
MFVGSLVMIVLLALTVPKGGGGPNARDDAAAGGSRLQVGSAESGSPAALDVAVPPGYGRIPAWTARIAGWTRNVATDDGVVLTRDPAGHVLLLDPTDGHRVWTSPEATTADEVGPWRGTIDGVQVAAVVGPGRLVYWGLPLSRAAASPPSTTATLSPQAGPPPSSRARPGKATAVPLPPGATVTWVGGSPLIELPNRTVAVIRSGALVQVPLPPGGRGLAAGGDGVLAVTSTTWVRQPAAQSPAAPRPIPRPEGAVGAPMRVEAVGTTLLLTIWQQANAAGQVLALMDTGSGTNVVRTTVTAAAQLRTFGIVRETGGTQLALGPVVVDTYALKVDLLDLRYVVKGLTRGHAWTTFSGRATDLHLTSKGDFTAVPFGTGEAALPIGVSRPNGGADRAVVVAPDHGGWLLCGLAAG